MTPNELTNGVINSCFFLLIKDLIRLYAAFNDGMINLLGRSICHRIRHGTELFFFSLEKYFDMNKKQCREALDIYKRFLDRTDKVSGFLKVAEVGHSFVFLRHRDTWAHRTRLVHRVEFSLSLVLTATLSLRLSGLSNCLSDKLAEESS